MTSPENVGQQFVHIYRGLEDITRLKDIDTDSVGVHWTTDENTAHEMAAPEWAVNEGMKPRGVVIHGTVKPEDVHSLDDPEMKGWEHWRMGDDHWEQEKTLRHGTTVNIEGIDHVQNSEEGHTSRPAKRFPKKATVRWES